MELKSKEDWARILAGNYIKNLCKEQNIETQEDVDNFTCSDCEPHDILNTILSIYISEMTDEDSMYESMKNV
jgi:hypothetical protein